MLMFVGLIVVTAAVIGGYLWEGGAIHLLYQPAEFLIIAGCSMGILLVSTPMSTLGEMMGQLKRLLSPAPTRKDYAELLVMMYQLFRVVQSTGVMALETHVDNAAQSPIFMKYPRFLARHSAVAFLSD